MKKLALLLTLTICLSKLPAQNSPSIEWEKCYGGNNDEEATSVHATSDGGYVVAGTTVSNDGDVSGNHGSSDFWIVKLDATGNIIWQKCLGGSDMEIEHAMQQTSDGGFIMAGESYSNDGDVPVNHGASDCWIVKLNSLGNIEWQKSYGGSGSDGASSIEQTSDGGYVFAGGSASNDGDVSGNHGSSDFWVVKLDALGNLIWQKSLGGTMSDYAASIRQTADKGYCITGSSSSKDDDLSSNFGSADCWVVKLDSIGNLEWQKNLGGTNQDIANDIIETSDHNYLIACWTFSDNADVSGNHGEADSWIVKLSSSGNIIWEKCLGGSSGDDAYSIQQTPDHGFIVAGYTASDDGDVSDINGSVDFWVFKLDSAGTILWQEPLGGSYGEVAYAIDQTAAGGFVVAGWTNSNDGEVTGHHDGDDFWVVKLQAITGIDESNFLTAFEVIPNPATKLITLQFQSEYNAAFPVSVIITNLLGETIFQKTSHCINGHLQEAIPLDEKFIEGIYLVRVSSEEQQWSAPLVIAR